MMHNLIGKIALLLIFVSFSPLIGEESFILINGNTSETIEEFGPDINDQVTPACSFNIVLSLMGYDSEVLKDEKTPVWDFSKRL